MKKIFLFAAAAMVITIILNKDVTTSKPQDADSVIHSSPLPKANGPLVSRQNLVIASPHQDLLKLQMKPEFEHDLESMGFDLKLDLQEISDRKLVAIINDPQGNSEVRKSAIEFFNKYLKKLNRYMDLKNKEVQEMSKAAI